MCYMIAVGIRPSRVDVVRKNLGDGLVSAPEYVARAFGTEYMSFLIPVGHCACDFFEAPVNEAELVRLRRKYRAKGWKDSRIERVVNERRKLGGLERGLLQHLVMAASSGDLTLMVYWDDGRTTPDGPSVQLSQAELLSKPYLVQAGTKIRIGSDQE